MSTCLEIREILTDIKKALNHNKLIPIDRRKNLDSLTQLGITWKDFIPREWRIKIS